MACGTGESRFDFNQLEDIILHSVLVRVKAKVEVKVKIKVMEKVKVKFTLEQATKAQRGSIGIAPLFL